MCNYLDSEMHRAEAVVVVLRLCVQREYLCVGKITIGIEVLVLRTVRRTLNIFSYLGKLPNWASPNFADT